MFRCSVLLLRYFLLFVTAAFASVVLAQAPTPSPDRNPLYGPAEPAHDLLRAKVEERNAAFAVCEPYRDYYAPAQACAVHYELKGGTGNVYTAAEALHTGELTVEQVLARFPGVQVAIGTYLVTHSSSTSYRGEVSHALVIHKFEGGRTSSISIDEADLATARTRGAWEKGWSKDGISRAEVVLLDEPLRPRQLPEAYAAAIRYSDCLIDTTETLRLTADRKRSDSVWLASSARGALHRDLKELLLSRKPAVHDSDEMKRIVDALETDHDYLPNGAWRTLQDFIREDERLRARLDAAVAEALAPGTPLVSGALVEIAAGFVSPETRLALLRRRRVVGFCSQDSAPREHAALIARTSASIAHWPTYLRANLDLLNDRFERMSDGSYAWGGRVSHVEAFEELGIDAAQLLEGTALRHERPSQNHYVGSNYRVGRAYGESDRSESYCDRLRTTLADATLDDLNRYLAYHRYATAVLWGDEPLPEATEAQLRQSAQALPEYMVTPALTALTKTLAERAKRIARMQEVREELIPLRG